MSSNVPQRFRKKPAVIEAIRWKGELTPEIKTFLGLDGKEDPPLAAFARGPAIPIVTLEGTMFVTVGDWIIRGTKNEIYPCKPDIFEDVYEHVIVDDGDEK